MFPAQCETSSIQVASRRRGAVQCPFCRDSLEGEAQAECSGCATLYHADCAQELASCAVLGCRGEIEALPEPAAPRGLGDFVVHGILALLPFLLIPYGPMILEVMADQFQTLVLGFVVLLLLIPVAMEVCRGMFWPKEGG